MLMRTIIYVFFIALSLNVKLHAQNRLFGPSVSYQYQKGNILKTGIYYATDIKPTNIFKIDLTVNSTWTQKQYALIPELALTYYSDMYYLGVFGRSEVTPYTLTPKVGFSFMTFMELDFGYGFSISQKRHYQPIKGFTTSLRFNIPLNNLL